MGARESWGLQRLWGPRILEVCWGLCFLGSRESRGLNGSRGTRGSPGIQGPGIWGGGGLGGPGCSWDVGCLGDSVPGICGVSVGVGFRSLGNLGESEDIRGLGDSGECPGTQGSRSSGDLGGGGGRSRDSGLWTRALGSQRRCGCAVRAGRPLAESRVSPAPPPSPPAPTPPQGPNLTQTRTVQRKKVRLYANLTHRHSHKKFK